MLFAPVYFAVTIAPIVLAVRFNSFDDVKNVPLLFGLMGMWISLGTLLALHSAFGVDFTFDIVNVAIIIVNGVSLFASYYLRLNR